MTESLVERVAKAIAAIDCNKDYRGMVMADGDGKWCINPQFADVLARAAIAATPLDDAKKAFEQISSFSDIEMGDGDGARRVANDWLERFAR